MLADGKHPNWVCPTTTDGRAMTSGSSGAVLSSSISHSAFEAVYSVKWRARSRGNISSRTMRSELSPQMYDVLT